MDSRDASPLAEAPAASEPEFARRTTAADARAYGCEHYKRRCKLLSPCCGEWFACRFCHDAIKHDEVANGHQMDRHLVQRIQCLGCLTEQPPAANCITCGPTMGQYFCSHCNLFDDDTSKQQFHCDKCGICRVGGRDNFFHCDTCGACYSIELKDNHQCVPDSMHRDCPICYEYLFDSLEAPQVLRCGHTIHRKCLMSYSKHGGYTCPLCNASVCDMRAAWLYLDEEIRQTPMPEEASVIVQMLCNDCHVQGDAAFHALGLKCGGCGSYNTRRR